MQPSRDCGTNCTPGAGRSSFASLHAEASLVCFDGSMLWKNNLLITGPLDIDAEKPSCRCQVCYAPSIQPSISFLSRLAVTSRTDGYYDTGWVEVGALRRRGGLGGGGVHGFVVTDPANGRAAVASGGLWLF